MRDENPLDQLLPYPMVQVYFVTIGGKIFTLMGPVTYLPELGIDAGTLEAFEVGDIIPAQVAADFFQRAEDHGSGTAGRVQ